MRYNIPTRPLATDDATQMRLEHTALRKRMLVGQWILDLEDELARHLPADRRESWGPADLSSNPFEQITRQLAVLYNQAPVVTNNQGDIEQLTGRNGYVTKAGLWPLMQRGQEFTIGLRECGVMVTVVPHHKSEYIGERGLQYRIVTPDNMLAYAHPDYPDKPVKVLEMRLRLDPFTQEHKWIGDLYDITNLNEPKYGMYELNKDGTIGNDVSALYMGHDAMVGEAYPFRYGTGEPFIPMTLYHAEKTGELFNAFDGSTSVYGSLNCGVLFSMWLHLVRDSAWSQKYILGAGIAGLNAMSGDSTARRAAIATDPSSILMLMSDPDAQGQPMVGTFEPPVSPNDLLEAITKYEVRVATSAGVSPDSITRKNADPRSGYALSIDKAGQRAAQRKYAPTQRIGDEELLGKSAALANRYLGTSLPESGYRIMYQSVGMSPDELKAQREDIIEKLKAGLISPIMAVQELNPDLDMQGAADLLRQIRRERAEFL
ncbi:MAG: hypothetical protein ACO3Q6_05650 [Ilumatobacteraceae bacterium]